MSNYTKFIVNFYLMFLFVSVLILEDIILSLVLIKERRETL